MADEPITTTEETTTQTVKTDVTPPEPSPAAEPQKSDKTEQEHMIPKGRFDEVNEKLKKAAEELEVLKKAELDAKKAADEAEIKAKEEQGKWKELYETERTKHEEAQAKAREAEAAANEARLASLRLKIGVELGVPAILASRLQGETEEEIKADAEQVLAGIPKVAPVITKTDSANGTNTKTPIPEKTEADIREEAARSGVSFEALRQYYEQQKAKAR